MDRRRFLALSLAAADSFANRAHGRARMVPRWDGDKLRHVSAAVTIDGRELPVETILARARLGDTDATIPHEKNTNRWKYT